MDALLPRILDMAALEQSRVGRAVVDQNGKPAEVAALLHGQLATVGCRHDTLDDAHERSVPPDTPRDELAAPGLIAVASVRAR